MHKFQVNRLTLHWLIQGQEAIYDLQDDTSWPYVSCTARTFGSDAHVWLRVLKHGACIAITLKHVKTGKTQFLEKLPQKISPAAGGASAAGQLAPQITQTTYKQRSAGRAYRHRHNAAHYYNAWLYTYYTTLCAIYLPYQTPPIYT